MFFGVPPRQVKSLDPRHKLLLETTYECIVDAGYNPKELKGSRTGKFLNFPIISFSVIEGLVDKS